jgi:hypothetical protein
MPFRLVEAMGVSVVDSVDAVVVVEVLGEQL